MERDYKTIEVTGRRSFQDFIGLLMLDITINKKNWDNKKLVHFLEAIHGNIKAIDGYYKSEHPELNAETPSWRTFADILRGSIKDQYYKKT